MAQPPHGQGVNTGGPGPQKKAPDAPPGFADHPATSQSWKSSNGKTPSQQAEAPSQQAFIELRQQFESLEREVELNKQKLQMTGIMWMPSLRVVPQRAQHTTALCIHPKEPPAFGCLEAMMGSAGCQIARSFTSRSRSGGLSHSSTFSAAASLHSHIYLFGGSPVTEDGSFTQMAQRFDIELGQWLSIALMSRPRENLAVSEMIGAFYAVGGGTASAQYDLAERYDPVSDRWTTVKPMGSPRFALAAAVLKGSMVCAGGFDGQRHLASAELYDPRAGRWEQVSPMSMPRANFSASSISEHELLAIAGCTSSDDCTSKCEILDLRMGKWRPTGPLAQPRAFGAAVGTEQIFAIGGLAKDMSTYLETVEVFKPQQELWSELKLQSKQPSLFKRAFFAAVARG